MNLQKSLNQPPKVLMILGSLPPMKCGVGDSMVILAQHIVAQGVPVSILTSQEAGDVPHVNTYKIMESWSIWNLIKITQKLFCIFRQTITTISKRRVIIVISNPWITTYTLYNV